MNEGKSFIRIEYILPFYLLLTQYSVGIVTLGDIALIVLALGYAIRSKGRVSLQSHFSPYLLLLGYILLRDTICLIACIGDSAVVWHRMVSYTVSFICMMAICSFDFDEDKLYKVWKIAGIIFSVGLMYHVICIFIFNTSVAPITIPGFTLRQAANRPTSFFAEPAAFINAMVPLLVMALRRYDYKVSIFVTIMIMMSTSTTGVFFVGLLWVLHFLKKDIGKKKKLFVLFTFIAFVVLFTQIDLFLDSYIKLKDVLIGESTFASRVSCGIEIARSQDVLQTIFGTNYSDINTYVTNNLNRFASDSSIIKYYSVKEYVFSNTFGVVMNKYGIIGFVLLLRTVLLFLKEKEYGVRDYVICFILALFGQSLTFNGYYFMINIFILLYQVKYRNDIENNNERMMI